MIKDRRVRELDPEERDAIQFYPGSSVEENQFGGMKGEAKKTMHKHRNIVRELIDNEDGRIVMVDGRYVCAALNTGDIKTLYALNEAELNILKGEFRTYAENAAMQGQLGAHRLQKTTTVVQ